MVANLQTSVPPQDIQYGVEQVMVGRLNFDSPARLTIGGLPANAFVTGIIAVTLTAFNAGTNNNLNVGITDPVATTDNYFVSAQAIGPTGPVAPALPATALPLSRPTNVTVGYAQSGGAANAGAALVVVRFVVPR